jgi:hypothetical protein
VISRDLFDWDSAEMLGVWGVPFRETLAGIASTPTSLVIFRMIVMGLKYCLVN